MKIRHRLLAMGGISILLCALLSVSSFWALDRMETAVLSGRASAEVLRNQMEADMMHDAVRSDVLSAQLAMLRQDESGLAQARKGLDEHAARMRDVMSMNDRLIKDATLKKDVAEAMADIDVYLGKAATLMSATSLDPAQQQLMLAAFDEVFSRLEKSMSRLSDGIQSMNQAEEATAGAAYSGSIVAQLLLMGGVLVCMVLGIWWVMRSIAGPMQQAVAVANEIANGNLTARIEVKGEDECSELMCALGKMQKGLVGMIAEIRDNAHQVTSAAIQLSGAAHSVADSSRQQNDSAGDMASTIEEMSASISRVADHAKEASNISGETVSLSMQGNEVIGRVVSSMKEIVSTVSGSSEVIQGLSKQSDQINAIVKVIKEIADQTNLLALNAAIEAARAGEQGRGFAVVADEVRSLAARTAQSTDEIGGVVQGILDSTRLAMNSMDKGVGVVAEGERLAGEAGGAIFSIRHNADTAINAVGQIAHAMQEQQIASSAIAHRVHEIVAMSEQNDRAVQEAAETAAHLNELAVRMQVAVSRFRI